MPKYLTSDVRIGIYFDLYGHQKIDECFKNIVFTIIENHLIKTFFHVNFNCRFNLKKLEDKGLLYLKSSV